MSLPMILLPDDGRTVKIGTKTTCTFKATGADTHGHFGLFEYTMDGGAPGPRPHIHKNLVEMFYVVDGEVELLLDRRKLVAPRLSFMLVPENTPHAFSNASSFQSKLLIMFCPADSREHYFEGMAELTRNRRVPSQEELTELMLQFDQYPVPDPTAP